MLQVTQLSGFMARTEAAASGPASVTYITKVEDISNTSPYTFTGASIGSEAADRIVVVAVASEGTGGAITIDSVTIGGNAATLAVKNSTNGRTVAGIYYLAVPSGTTATIVVTISTGSPQRCVIGIWNVNGAASGTPYDTDTASNNTGGSTTTTLSGLDFADNSVGICCSTHGDGGAVSWTNATERYDTATAEGNHRASGADLTQATATTTLDITITHSGLVQNVNAAGASWA
jgi:hypothetical protein